MIISVNRDRPLVSVLMTSYYREDFIADAIESVLASTYTNFELIIVDDCSKDKTVDIARSYANKDGRVKVFVNEHNLGDYPNRNKAASYATGKYLKYIDADDYLYPWGLDLLVDMMEQFPEAAWGFCSLLPDESQPYPILLKNAEEIFTYNYFGPGILHKAPLSSIIKKEAFDSVGGFSGKKHLGDFEFWHILSLKYPLLLMPEGMVWHRIHDNQQSAENRVDPEVALKYYISAANFFKNNNAIPISGELRDRIYRKLNTTIIKTILVRIRRGHLKIAYKLYKATKNPDYVLMGKTISNE